MIVKRHPETRYSVKNNPLSYPHNEAIHLGVLGSVTVGGLAGYA